MGDTILVETTGLNAFLHTGSWVPVRLSDSYVMKRGEDLQVGDVVVIKTESIDKTLAEVEPVLAESARYLAAKHVVHDVNSRGAFVPRLRTLLLSGLTREDARDDLEARILREGGEDFSAAEYEAFNACVRGTGVTVGQAAIVNWLRGETLAPDDWENFSLLAGLHPDFRPIYESRDQPAGFHASYELYVGLRRSIMSYLAKRGERQGGDGDDDRDDRPRHPQGVYAQEIELVVRRFLSEIDSEHSGARVTRIQPVKETSGGQDHERPNPHLSRGIVVTQPEDGFKGLKKRTMREVVEGSYLLSNAFYNTLADHLMKTLSSVDLPKPGTQEHTRQLILLHAFQPYAASHLIKRSSTEQEIAEYTIVSIVDVLHRLHSAKPTPQLQHLVRAELDTEYQAFMRKLGDGSVDSSLGFAPHTMGNLIDLVNQYRYALPRSYLRWQVLNTRRKSIGVLVKNADTKKERADLQRQYKDTIADWERVNAYLERHYGPIHTRKFLLLGHFRDAQGAQTMAEIAQDIPDDHLAIYRRLREQEGIQFFNRREVRLFFEEAGIPDAATTFSKQNFVMAADDETIRRYRRQGIRQ